MRSIVDIMICEAIKERHLRELEQQCKMYGTNFIDIVKTLYNLPINWDKLTDSDVQSYDIDRSIKIIRGLRTEGRQPKEFKSCSVIVLGHEGDIYKYIYYPTSDRVVKFTGDNKERYRDAISTMNLKPSDIYDTFKGCDEIVFLDFTDLSTSDLKANRLATKQGAWQLSDKDHHSKHLVKGELGKSAGGLEVGYYGSHDYGSFYAACINLAKKNRDRYKNIAAERKALNVDTSDVDKIVEEAYKLSERGTKLYLTSMKGVSGEYNPSITSANYRYNELNKYLGQLLSHYGTLISKLGDLKKKGGAWSGKSYARYALDEINNTKPKIEEDYKLMKEKALELEETCKRLK